MVPRDTPDTKIYSNSFRSNGYLKDYVGRYNGNESPDFEIVDIPPGTKEYVITMVDEDVSKYHWAVWNIPASKTRIKRKEKWSGTGATVGDNDFGNGYIGPFPPSTHSYKFTFYFLDSGITLSKGSYNKIPNAVDGKVIRIVSLSGLYAP